MKSCKSFFTLLDGELIFTGHSINYWNTDKYSEKSNFKKHTKIFYNKEAAIDF